MPSDEEIKAFAESVKVQFYKDILDHICREICDYGTLYDEYEKLLKDLSGWRERHKLEAKIDVALKSVFNLDPKKFNGPDDYIVRFL